MRRTDVLVVGAGAAGLACARDLRALGVEVRVLEARERVGGRVWTLHGFVDEPVELGAMLVHGERSAVMDVVRAAGLTATPPPARGGEAWIMLDGRLRPAAEVLAEAGVGGLWSVEREVAAGPAPDRPLATELAARGWGRLRQELACEWFAQVWCADPGRLSAAGVARVEAAWASGRQNLVVREGYDRVTQWLARGLEVECGAEVRLLRWGRGWVEAETADGRRLRASAAVLTVPPSVVAAGRLVFDPPLDGERMASARAIPLGGVIRVAVRLREPAPEGGWLMVVGPEGGFWSVAPGSRLVTGWIGGPAATRLSGAGWERLAQRLRPAFRWLEERSAEEVVVADWGADPLSLGGYSYPAVGALDRPAAWAAPECATLFFAGEATCGDRHPATVHGAMESGRRAAREVADALGR